MRTVLIVLALLLVSSVAPAADPRDSDRATLTGLGSLLVLVKADDAARQKGVDADAIAAEITSSLRAAGLTVHESVAEARAKSERDFAIVVADVVLADEAADLSGRLVYSVDLEVKQMSTLARDPERRSLAVTWQVSTVGVGSIAALRSAIATMTATFVDQYRAANAAGG